MSITNDNSNISLEINNKKPSILYDEVDIISTNRKIVQPIEGSYVIGISKENKMGKNIDKSNELLFGTSINITKPRKIGSVYAFFYIKGFPLIIIGPDCK